MYPVLEISNNQMNTRVKESGPCGGKAKTVKTSLLLDHETNDTLSTVVTRERENEVKKERVGWFW